MAQNPDMWKRRESFTTEHGFNPFIYGNDVDSVDVATRVAMVIGLSFLENTSSKKWIVIRTTAFTFANITWFLKLHQIMFVFLRGWAEYVLFPGKKKMLFMLSFLIFPTNWLTLLLFRWSSLILLTHWLTLLNTLVPWGCTPVQWWLFNSTALWSPGQLKPSSLQYCLKHR